MESLEIFNVQIITCKRSRRGLKLNKLGLITFACGEMKKKKKFI